MGDKSLAPYGGQEFCKGVLGVGALTNLGWRKDTAAGRGCKWRVKFLCY